MGGAAQVYNPPKPTHAKLVKLYGEPPWALVVDDFGFVPEEDTECVGMLVWRGMLYAATGRAYRPMDREGGAKEVGE